ncbi:HpaII family restriction endonuclease (plasmid) [Acinetobacter baumannii]
MKFENTRIDTASTTKHKFGSIYQEYEKYYIKINLLIRN